MICLDVQIIAVDFMCVDSSIKEHVGFLYLLSVRFRIYLEQINSHSFDRYWDKLSQFSKEKLVSFFSS